MRVGDLVEFKAGSFGIEAPQNLGIYLDREKRKDGFYVVLFTVKGRKEFKRDRMGGVRLSARLGADAVADEKVLAQRLRDMLRESASGAPEEARRASEQATDRDLWRRVDLSGRPLTVREMATSYFAAKEPASQHFDAVRRILESCARPGVGYFERVPGREELWRPLTRDEHKRVTTEREALNALRNRLVRAEEVEDEDGRLRTAYRGVPTAEAGLTDEDRRRLHFVRHAMADFVLHDRFTGDAALTERKVHTIDGWHLLDFLRFLAADWTGSRTSMSSTFVEFLVRAGEWTDEDAITTVAERKVLATARPAGGFEWTMDERAVAEAQRFPDAFPPEWLAGRADLRETECCTIDPADAKDHDDAVGVERLPDGRWLLRVHIADVSHYVAPGTRLDAMARRRATSLYLPTGVLPMLPPRLSEDLCSLKEDVDRLALTNDIVYDAEGNIVEERFHESVIRVRANATYPEADRAIADGREPFASMHRLAELLQAKRRGLALETGEVKIIVTPEAVERDVKLATEATRMIEAFMVASNESVARRLAKDGVPLLYRCHPLPDRVSVDRFNAQMRTMEQPVAIALPAPKDAAADAEGPSVLDLLKKGGTLTLVGGGYLDEAAEAERDAEPGAGVEGPPPLLAGLAQLPPDEQEAWLAPFRAALGPVNAIKDPDLREIVHVKLLACMGRAIYTPANLGHFGLGSTCYCHFTSPIRRYPDLVVHRQLRAVLRGETPPHTREDLLDMAPHVSDQGALADDLERGVVNVCLVFHERGAGRAWPRPGLVNGITRGGVFVTLGHGLEGRVATMDIPGGPWSVDDHDSYLFAGSRDRPTREQVVDAKEWRELFDERLGEMVRVRLRLGERLTCTPAGFDYVDGKVALRLAE